MKTLSDRMKDYEAISDYRLISKLPVILRLDGRAFHTYTRNLDKPYDSDFRELMSFTMKTLCEEISGAKIAYTQSDEISILLTDCDNINTEAWFGNRIQKLVSISSAICSTVFNNEADAFLKHKVPKVKIPVFDCRAFNLPLHEVANYFIFRQKDCERNSLSMLAQANFSHKELQGANSAKMHDMLNSKGINWNDYPASFKRGVCALKIDGKWIIDNDISVFTQDRSYITNCLLTDLNKENE
jgi:tRNA(His) 5'-end guanylyltransferase